MPFLKKAGLFIVIALVESAFQMIGMLRQSSSVTLSLSSTSSSSSLNYLSAMLLPKEPPSPPPHPHAGARYSNGSWGYVADVKRVRRWMRNRRKQAYKRATTNNATTTTTTTSERDRVDFKRSYLPLGSILDGDNETIQICQTPPGKGFEGKNGWDLLTDRVVVNGSEPVLLLPPNSSSSNASSSLFVDNEKKRKQQPKAFNRKILCAVYTHGPNHYRVRGITETWGWRCDGFFAASTNTTDGPKDLGFGAIDLAHLGPEEYNNMWQKTRSILAYMYDNYLDEYDYFFVSGDDTYVIVENLRNFLSIMEDKQRRMGLKPRSSPLYMGSRIPAVFGFDFAGGGPGYVMNRYALKQFAELALPTCLNGTHKAAEDRYLGGCMNKIGIKLNDTTDALGRQRFQNMHPDFMARYDGKTGRFFSGLYNYWANISQHGFKAGKEIVSSQSVSFHILRSPVTMKRIHAILYDSCPAGTVLSNALKNITRTRRNNHSSRPVVLREENGKDVQQSLRKKQSFMNKQGRMEK